MLWTRAVGGIAVVFGVLFLLYLFAWCTLMPPGLTGWVWWSRVLGTMVSRGAVAGTALGAACVAGGVFLLLLPAKRGSTIIAAVVAAALVVLYFTRPGVRHLQIPGS